MAMTPGKVIESSSVISWNLTHIDGQMKRCRPAFEGQSNSYLMDPFALQGP